MKLSQRRAFTLIELIMAITVFTVFVGFVFSVAIRFQRSQQENAIERTLILELEGLSAQLRDSLQDFIIDYGYYEAQQGLSLDPLSRELLSTYRFDLGVQDQSRVSTLRLVHPTGSEYRIYEWDEEEEKLWYQELDAQQQPKPGFEEPRLLHDSGVHATQVQFNFFPSQSPYASENQDNVNVQYQPMVQYQLELSLPGRVRDWVRVDLQSSVTSRFIQ